MKTQEILFPAAVMGLALLVVSPSVNGQALIGTAFSYQGQLKRGGVPVDDACDFLFTVWDAPSGGSQVAYPVSTNSVPVIDGLFDVAVDFGPGGFAGDARWMEIGVQCLGDVGFTKLTPRQKLTPAPYALALPGLWTQQNATSPNVIAGHRDNTASSGVVGATIGGGGQAGAVNSVEADLATVAGGENNRATGVGAFVGAGSGNLATSQNSTVAGGRENSANGAGAFIGAGYNNECMGANAVVAGGYNNKALAGGATVPGGYYNDATGLYSFAAGRRAKALHDGAFVWADSTDLDFASTANDQFLISAAGGVGINTNGPQAALHLGGTPGVDGIMFPDGTLQTTAAGGAADAWSLTGNAGTNVNTDFLGTTDDEPFEVRVNNERALRLEPAPYLEDYETSPNLIGGWTGNYVSSNAFGATIGGGGYAYFILGLPNRVTDSLGTVGGGANNQAGDDAGTTDDAGAATVGGGASNVASANSATVGGGSANEAGADYATVSGGLDNMASGYAAAIPGGTHNEAVGEYSFAAGRYAKALHDGAFVWADSTTEYPYPFESTGADQFSVRATGGVRLDVDTNGGGLRIEPNATSLNVIAGHAVNSTTNGVYGATVAGGGTSSWPNRVTGNYGTVSGGSRNTASGGYANVAGGFNNVASSSSSTVGGGSGNASTATYTTVGGGYYNTASDDYATVAGGDQNLALSQYATIGGGWSNLASGFLATVAGGRDNNVGGNSATVGGGYLNSASGLAATVPGGNANSAAGDYAFAAGNKANANHVGAFVWADSTDVNFYSQQNDQFRVRASGGVEFVVDAGSSGLFIDSAGNIGIGTVTPTNGLHVAANLKVDGDTTGHAVSATAEDDDAYGVSAEAKGIRGRAVQGEATNTADFTNYGGHFIAAGVYGRGVYGEASGNSGRGVYGKASQTEGAANFGGYFEAAGELGTGVYGEASATQGIFPNCGGYFVSAGYQGRGVYGKATGTYGVGVYAEATGTSGRAAHFVGDVALEGVIDSLGSQPFELHVDGERALRIEPNATSPNVINGHGGNVATGGAIGVTIGGGGSATSPNRVTSDYGTVGGGSDNTAGGPHAIVCGGWLNEATSNGATVCGGGANDASDHHAFVGGGYANMASSDYAVVAGGGFNVASDWYTTVGAGFRNTASGRYATVGGGAYNTASGEIASVGGGVLNAASASGATVAGGEANTAGFPYATVGGGGSNDATGIAATVVGGYWNNAAGDYSLAAGRRARANANGCFVWGDSTNADVTCDVYDRWVARASGGVYFYTKSDLGTGSYLAAGGNSWNSVSDRATKEDFTSVDRRALLEMLAELPVHEYKLKNQDAFIRHIGPVAQDFARFGYGESDLAINLQDADGVALAAIQGLYDIVKEKQAQIELLRAEKDAEIAAQREQIADLTARLQRIEEMLPDPAGAEIGGAQ